MGCAVKILMICEFFDPDLEFQENLALKYYRKHGHDVMLLTSAYTSVFDYYAARPIPKPSATTFEHQGATVHRLPYAFNLMNRLRPLRGVRGLVEAFAPDLIFVHDVSVNFPELAAYVGRHPGCRMIMDYHADYSNSGRGWLSLKVLHGTIRRYLLDAARPHLARIFPIVPAGFTFLHEIYGVPMEEMELLPLGADLDLIAAVQSSRSTGALRDHYALTAEDLVIVTGGKITPRKRIELLLQAMDCGGLRNAKLLVLGEFAAEDAPVFER